jgi:NADH dehydrogenase
MARATELASGLSLGLFPALLTTTRDQIDLLREDNVVSPEAMAQQRSLTGLGIQPRGVETVLPAYMSRFRKTGQYAPNRFA